MKRCNYVSRGGAKVTPLWKEEEGTKRDLTRNRALGGKTQVMGSQCKEPLTSILQRDEWKIKKDGRGQKGGSLKSGVNRDNHSTFWS